MSSFREQGDEVYISGKGPNTVVGTIESSEKNEPEKSAVA
jgi:hypothetical protein